MAKRRTYVPIHFTPPPRPGLITSEEWWQLLDKGYQVGVTADGYPVARRGARAWKPVKGLLWQRRLGLFPREDG